MSHRPNSDHAIPVRLTTDSENYGRTQFFTDSTISLLRQSKPLLSGGTSGMLSLSVLAAFVAFRLVSASACA